MPKMDWEEEWDNETSFQKDIKEDQTHFSASKTDIQQKSVNEPVEDPKTFSAVQEQKEDQFKPVSKETSISQPVVLHSTSTDVPEKKYKKLTGFLATLSDVLSPEILSFIDVEVKSSGLSPEEVVAIKRLLPNDVLVKKIADFYKSDVASDLQIDEDLFVKNMIFFITKNVVPLKDGSFAITSKRVTPTLQQEINTMGLGTHQTYRNVKVRISELRKISRILRTTAAKFRDTPEDLSTKITGMVEKGDYSLAMKSIIQYSFQLYASDIHLERRERHGILRFRIDGVMEDITSFKAGVYTRLIGAVYSLTKSQQPNIQESGDGAFDMVDLPVQLRVSFYPSLYGDHNVVMRLLPKTQETPTGLDLGYDPETWQHIVDVANHTTSGIILYIGPTGSGKTSSLFALLSEIDTKGRKLLEVADPVEYQHAMGIQAQVVDTDKLQWKYADALRSALRHDPDIILVGEIRDPESAKIALDASRTGHTVFSTVHAETTWEAFDRLSDLGLPVKYILSSVKMLVSQRLVRRLCNVCYGKGCYNCRYTGYAGRFAIAEVLTMTDALREELNGSIPVSKNQQEKVAKLHSPLYMPLREAAIAAVRAKKTDMKECIRVLGYFVERRRDE